MPACSLIDHPIHLGRAGTASIEPRIEPDMQWYVDYVARHADDGREGRLISEYVFTDDWTSWERHPHGSEIVYCLSGTLILHQELTEGQIETVTLKAGQYAINPPGVWHTADVEGEVRALFITAGEGTEHRSR